MPCVAELKFRILRHALNLQREDAQTPHHFRNAIGNHAKVFGTCKHACGIKQWREFPHCLAIPEAVMTVIEEISVKTVEVPFGIVRQHSELIGILGGDARMIVSFLIGIFNEKYIVDDPKQCVHYPRILLIARTSSELTLNFLLRVDKGF